MTEIIITSVGVVVCSARSDVMAFKMLVTYYKSDGDHYFSFQIYSMSRTDTNYSLYVSSLLHNLYFSVSNGLVVNKLVFSSIIVRFLVCDIIVCHQIYHSSLFNQNVKAGR